MSLLMFSIVALVFALFALCINNGDVLSPSVISFGSFFVTSFIAFSHNGFGEWGISIDTFLILITTLLMFCLGSIVTSVFFRNSISFSEPYIIQTTISGKFSLASLIFIGIVAVLNFRATLNIARSIYGGSTIMNMLGYARNAYLFTEASIGTVLSILVLITNGVGYYYTYDIISQIISKEYRNKAILLIEVLCVITFLANSMLGSGRTFLIKWLVFDLVVAYYLYYSLHEIRRLTITRIVKMVRIIIIFMLVFFVAFQLMGMLTEKTGKLNTSDMLYGYSGAAVVALDEAIETYQPDGRFFGEECFYGLYGFLNKFGFNIPNRILHLPFVPCGDGLRTNIYCSIRSYLYDFGFAGMYLVQFIIGFVSGFMYRMLRIKYYNRPVFLLLYSLLMYGLVMQGIEEILLRNFMSVTNVITFLSYAGLFFLSKKTRVELN